MQVAKGVMLIYSPTSRASFERLPEWIDLLVAARHLMPSRLPPVALSIVENTVDAQAEREVSLQEGTEFAQAAGASFWVADCVTGDDCVKAMEELALSVLVQEHDTWAFWARESRRWTQAAREGKLSTRQFLSQAVLDALSRKRGFRNDFWYEASRALFLGRYRPPLSRGSALFVSAVTSVPKVIRKQYNLRIRGA